MVNRDTAARVPACGAEGDSMAEHALPGDGAHTGRHSPAGLHEHVARLHEGLAQAHRDLAKHVQIRLDVPGELSHITGVDGDSPIPAPLLTAKDLSTLMQVDAKTIRRWRSEGLLPPAFEIGGVVRWSVKVIEAWIDGGVQ